MALFIYYLLIIGSTFIPGWLLYTAFFRTETDGPSISCALSFALAVVMISTIHLCSFFFFENIQIGNVCLYLIVVCGLYGYMKIMGTRVSALPYELAVFVIFTLYCFFLLTLVPNYDTAFMNDWALYFRNTFIYLRKLSPACFKSEIPMKYLLVRTPFFSLYNSFYLSFFGSQYSLYQAISTFLNSLIFWGIYLIGKNIFGSKTARVSLLLLPIIPLMINHIGIPTPKPIMIFFLCITYWSYFQIRNNTACFSITKETVLCAIGAVSAYMCHPMALLYLVGIIGDHIYGYMFKKKSMNSALVVCMIGAAGVLIGPWYVWKFLCFGKEGIVIVPCAMTEGPVSIMHYLMSRVRMLGTSLFMCDSLVVSLQNILYRGASLCNKVLLGDALMRFYMETFLGGMTLTGSFFFIVAWIRAKRTLSPHWRLFLIIFSGGLLSLGIHLLIDYKGLAFTLFGPCVVLVYLFFCSRVAQLPQAFQRRILFYGISEFIVMRGIYYYVGLFKERTYYYIFQYYADLFPLFPLVAVGICMTLLLLYIILVRKIENAPETERATHA